MNSTLARESTAGAGTKYIALDVRALILHPEPGPSHRPKFLARLVRTGPNAGKWEIPGLVVGFGSHMVEACAIHIREEHGLEIGRLRLRHLDPIEEVIATGADGATKYHSVTHPVLV